ncbi:MAG TPA: DUF4440 domain-containing protein [Xanthobacteraceae bacterium]|nr:DUF4440 domain-containing protein [Xanthobacteraceae bacterium]
MRMLRASLAAVLLVLCALPARADAQAEIRARLQQWTEAFNARDAAKACELFSTSLVSDVRGQGEAGYARRCGLIAKALEDPARSLRYGADIKEVIVEGDLAVVRLTWTLTISPGDIRSVEPGLDVFRKEADGQWRIIRFMAYEAE